MSDFTLSDQVCSHLVNGLIHLLEYDEDIVKDDDEINSDRYGKLNGSISLGYENGYADISVLYREGIPEYMNIFLFRTDPRFKKYDASGGVRKRSNKKWEWIFKEIQKMSEHMDMAVPDKNNGLILQGFIEPEFYSRRMKLVPETRVVLVWNSEHLESIKIFPDSQMRSINEPYERYKS